MSSISGLRAFRNGGQTGQIQRILTSNKELPTIELLELMFDGERAQLYERLKIQLSEARGQGEAQPIASLLIEGRGKFFPTVEEEAQKIIEQVQRNVSKIAIEAETVIAEQVDLIKQYILDNYS